MSSSGASNSECWLNKNDSVYPWLFSRWPAALMVRYHRYVGSQIDSWEYPNEKLKNLLNSFMKQRNHKQKRQHIHSANDINKQNILSFILFHRNHKYFKPSNFQHFEKNKSANYYIFYHRFVWAHHVESKHHQNHQSSSSSRCRHSSHLFFLFASKVREPNK